MYPSHFGARVGGHPKGVCPPSGRGGRVASGGSEGFALAGRRGSSRGSTVAGKKPEGASEGVAPSCAGWEKASAEGSDSPGVVGGVASEGGRTARREKADGQPGPRLRGAGPPRGDPWSTRGGSRLAPGHRPVRSAATAGRRPSGHVVRARAVRALAAFPRPLVKPARPFCPRLPRFFRFPVLGYRPPLLHRVSRLPAAPTLPVPGIRET